MVKGHTSKSNLSVVQCQVSFFVHFIVSLGACEESKHPERSDGAKWVNIKAVRRKLTRFACDA